MASRTRGFYAHQAIRSFHLHGFHIDRDYGLWLSVIVGRRAVRGRLPHLAGHYAKQTKKLNEDADGAGR